MPRAADTTTILPQQMNENDHKEYLQLEALHDWSLRLWGFDMTSATQTDLGGDDGAMDSPDPPTNEVDHQSAALGNLYLERYPLREDEGCIFSCVLKDPWHLMNQISIPANHGLRHRFAIKWRDILFVSDALDKAQIEAYAVKQGKYSLIICSATCILIHQMFLSRKNL